MLNFKFWEANSGGITVYHGSRTNGLQRLKGHMPSYVGGLGHGVYVGTEIGTGEFYGEHVYELVTKFGWEEVLEIGEDNYEGLEGDSVLVGESVPPFTFLVKGKKYAVTGGDYTSDSVSKGIFVKNLFDLLGVDYHYSGLKKTDRTWRYFPAIQNSLNKLMRFNDFDEDDFREEIEQWVYRYWSDKDYLPGETGQMAMTQKKMRKDQRVQSIFNDFKRFVIQAEKTTDIGEEIGLEDVGGVVEKAGFRAVYVVGIRMGSGVNEEMLVFNEKDLKMVKQIS